MYNNLILTLQLERQRRPEVKCIKIWVEKELKRNIEIQDLNSATPW
jgi:hypothetical protein